MCETRCPCNRALLFVLGLAACGGAVDPADPVSAGGASNSELAGSGGTSPGDSTTGGTAATASTSEQTLCVAASSSFVSRLSTATCVITLRVDYSAASVLGYQIACGTGITVTESSALEPLLSMSSVNWQNSTLVSEPVTTGVYAFQSVSPVVLSVTSARTGEHLVYVSQGSEAYTTPAEWYAGSEIDGDCADADSALYASFGQTDSSFAPEMAVRLLAQRGLFLALARQFGTSYDTVGAAQIDLTTGAEYLVVVTISPRA